MRFDTELPKDYLRVMNMPPFKGDKITLRTLYGVENALYVYSNLARKYSKATENNPRNFYVSDIYLVGSSALRNEKDSDLDLMFICPDIDEGSAKTLKTMISLVLFCDRDKKEGVDVFLRKEDQFPERASVNITNQLESLIKKYNLLNH